MKEGSEEEKYFNSRWLVSYERLGEEMSVYIDADYEVYAEQRIVEVLTEVHPDWTIKEVQKVDSLPWET